MLLAHGHSDATGYPLGMVEDEVRLVLDRTNGLLVTGGAIIQSAGAAMMTKQGGTQFQALMKQIAGE